MDKELSVLEISRLSQLEIIVEKGLKSFLETGNALIAIRDEQLYRDEYGTFEEYCKERWGISTSRASRLMTAASAVNDLEATTPNRLGIVPMGTIPNQDGQECVPLVLPRNERQARELTKIPKEKRKEVWDATLEATGGKPTAAAVAKVAKVVVPRPEPAPKTVKSVISKLTSLGKVPKDEVREVFDGILSEPHDEMTPEAKTATEKAAEAQARRDAMPARTSWDIDNKFNDLIGRVADAISDLQTLNYFEVMTDEVERRKELSMLTVSIEILTGIRDSIASGANFDSEVPRPT